MNKKELGAFWNRLINVLYGLGWVGILIAVVITFITTKPYEYLDEDKTSIFCLPSNKNFSYAKVSEYIDKLPYENKAGIYTIEGKSQLFCDVAIAEFDLKYRQSPDNVLQYLGEKGEVYSENDQKWFENTQQNRKIIVTNIKNQYPLGIYKINEVNSTHGSWGNLALWMVGVFIVLTIVLDVLKAVLLYLVVGTKIQIKDFTLLKLFSGVEYK